MASVPRGALRRIKESVTHADVRRRLEAIEAQLAELTHIASVQVEVTNESTELLGRLLRSATDRIDELEERVSGGR